MITFRLATPEDAELLSKTRQKVWDATYRGIYSDEKIDNYDFARLIARDKARIANPDNTYYLVMDGELCAGYFYYGPEQNGGQYKDFQLCLNSLYFLPAYQGMGLGSRVFAHMRQVCRERGLHKFFCTCNIHNKKAQGFYEKMGGIVGCIDGNHADKADDQMYFEFTIGDTI